MSVRLDEPQTFSETIVSRAAGAFSTRTSRRSFLLRISLIGSALAVAPVRFLMRPESAWGVVTRALTCDCPPGSGCTCGSSTCCDDQTSTFCCSLGYTNGPACPVGHACGYWYCSSTGYFYLDCCSSDCGSIGCKCAGGNCGNRKECCYDVEWTNCDQTTGKIICRITRHIQPIRTQCGLVACGGQNILSDQCTVPPACASNPQC